MHDTAKKNCTHFLDCYASHFDRPRVVDVGSLDVNGSLRDCIHFDVNYVGVDFSAGNNVDVVINDASVLPFDDESVDVVLCSSVFEHSTFFWETYLEILRILKPSGLFYLNVPSNGRYHAYPVDCWRFYPDSGHALALWGEKKGYAPLVLESFIAKQGVEKGNWSDFVCVTLKDRKFQNDFPNRMIDGLKNFTNGKSDRHDEFVNYHAIPEDQRNWGWKLAAKLRRRFGRLKA